jgi:glutamate---cysteine ligase / carboxylate-amine ligase
MIGVLGCSDKIFHGDVRMGEDYRFGIEEEYFVNDAEKRDVARSRTRDFFDSCRKNLPGDIQREMLEPQVEVATPPSGDFAEARRTLAELRRGVGEMAARHGLAVMAAGTHPLAAWNRVRGTPSPRYGRITHELQMIGSRNVVCGLHVHVELPAGSSRIDVMNRLQPFLPLLLALSTSSPFWQGQRTGLLGYRLAAYREIPRTWLPPPFDGEADYDRFVDTLVRSRAIEDASLLWWVVRPSAKHPTLELRIADSCTRLDDTLAVAALYRCLVRRLDRDKDLNRGPTGASHAIVAENCWRAQRYGIHGSFVDERTRTAKPVRDVLCETLALLRDDARALGCEGELDLCRWILAYGTSADRQLAVYTEAVGRGRPNRDALIAVVDALTAETAGERGTALRAA